MAKSVDQIMNEYQRRRQDNIGRNRDYAYLHAIYHGLYFDNRNRDMMDGQGRVLLRDNRREDRANPLVANLLKGIVDDYVSLVSILPDVKVPPPSPDKGGQDFADMMEKYHYGVWHASQMSIQLKCMAWWASVMGGSAALVWPNFQKKHAEIRFVGPDKVYGTVDLIDPFAYSSAIIAEQYSQRTIRDYFPQRAVQELFHGEENSVTAASKLASTNGGSVEVIRYFDKTEVITILGREKTTIRGKPTGETEAIIELGRVKHDLGYCLVVPFQNLLVPGETRGMGDIEESVGLNQYINFLMNADEEYIKQELFSPLILVDAQKAPEDIHLDDPYEIIPINAGGDAHRLVTSTTGQQVMQSEMARAQQLIEYVAGTPQVRTEGRLRSSISTGRAMEKAQGPHYGRIEYRNDLNAFRLEKANELSVLLTQSEFGDDEVQLFGTRARGGGMFRVVMKGKDLQNYTFNKVLYSPSMHMGLDQRIVAVLQLRGAQPRPLIDARTAIEILGITDHPDEMLQAIEEEMKHDIAFQAELKNAMGAGGQPGGAGQPVDPTKDKASLESGTTPKPGAPGPINSSSTSPTAGGAAEGGSPISGPTPLGSMAPSAPAKPDIGGAANLMSSANPVPPPRSGLEIDGQGLEQQIRQAIAGLKLNDDVYLISADVDQISIVAKNYIDARRVGRVLRGRWGDRVSVRQSDRIPKDATLLNAKGPATGGGTNALPSKAQQVQPQGQ